MTKQEIYKQAIKYINDQRSPHDNWITDCEELWLIIDDLSTKDKDYNDFHHGAFTDDE